jgi:hypothetical protein
MPEDGFARGLDIRKSLEQKTEMRGNGSQDLAKKGLQLSGTLLLATGEAVLTRRSWFLTFLIQSLALSLRKEWFAPVYSQHVLWSKPNASSAKMDCRKPETVWGPASRTPVTVVSSSTEYSPRTYNGIMCCSVMTQRSRPAKIPRIMSAKFQRSRSEFLPTQHVRLLTTPPYSPNNSE